MTQRQKANAPSTFIDDLANAIYTPENIERANGYARSRGVDPACFAFPWAATDGNANYFNYFRDVYPPVIFTDCLYIPVLEIDCLPSAPRLAGFDVRYLGEHAHRLRWHKFKRDHQAQLMYNLHEILKTDFVVITEGALDAEAFRSVGIPAFAALTALKSARFVHFLYATGKKVYLAFDNDDDGQKATQWIIKYAVKFPQAVGYFQPLIYPTKDPAKAIQQLGRDGFRSKVAYQIPEIQNVAI